MKEIVGYCCTTAAHHELGRTDVTIYPTPEAIMAAESCVNEQCGFVKVLIRVTDGETMSEQLGDLPEPCAWMTHESKWRLIEGGNARGAVPIHGRRSATATIALYTAEQMQIERERCFALGRTIKEVEPQIAQPITRLVE